LTLPLLVSLAGASTPEADADLTLTGIPTLADDDECSSGSPSCAWSALQLRSVAKAGDAASQESGESSFDGFDGFRMEAVGEEAVVDNKCGEEAYDVSSEGCCGGTAVFTLATHACCGGTPYAFGEQGCCNEKTVFSLKDPHGCVAASSSGGGAGANATSIADFDCQAQWPLSTAKSGWSYYCSHHSHKVWAMDHKCSQAWYVVKKSSVEVAQQKALATCEKRGKEKCFIFDTDGSVCGEHAQTRYCNGKAYDISSEGCCNGEVYKYGTHDCCGKKEVFHRKNQGCCAGTVFESATYGCCGGKKVFETGTHGCCLNRGIQIYEMGTQNCCHRKGVCTIHHGQWSCC